MMENLGTLYTLLLFTTVSAAAGGELWGNHVSSVVPELKGSPAFSGPGDVVLSGPSTIVVGHNYRFVCQTVCNPACNFAWFFNGNLTVSDSNELLLHPARYRDDGIFSCQAQNPVTLVQKTVYKPVRVTDPKNNISISSNSDYPPVLGLPYILQCHMSGNLSSVMWLKNNIPIFSWPGENFQLFNNDTTLYFNYLTMADNAIFVCIAWLNRGPLSLASESYTLRVNYGPEQPVIIGNKMLVLGLASRFRCSVDCQPPCDYTWYLGNRLLRHGNRVSVGFTNLTDSSNLTCKARNPTSGQFSTASVLLTANVTLVQPVSNHQLSLANKSYSLTCSTYSKFSTIYWFQDGFPVLTNSRVTLTQNNSTLSFHPLEPSDTAFYQCSPIPQALGTGFGLFVSYGPVGGLIFGSSEIRIGQYASFTCSVQSYPPCNYTWYLNGIEVGHGDTYTVNSVTPADNSTLQCVAYNTVTRSSTEVSLVLTVYNGVSVFKLSGAALLALLIPLILPLVIH